MKIPQSIPKERRFTFNEFNAQFPDDDACLAWFMEKRYAGSRALCSYCKVERLHHKIAGKKAWACDHCGTYISPLAGTIFEKSSTSLRLWFYSIYLMSATRCGISAKQIQRETGVTYKTAWRIFKQVRTLMSESIRLEGPTVEMDETYFGGKRRGVRAMETGGKGNKAVIVGIVERTGKGRVSAVVASDATRKTLHGIAEERILPESTVYTDDLNAYHGLAAKGYNHRRINHSAGVYVMGDVHTQTIDGFWSLIKRGIGGVYHAVSQKYLQTYLDEYSYRYNRRAASEPMFTSLLNQAVAKAE
jgi:transposase